MPPQLGAAAAEKDAFEVYQTAKSTCTSLRKHHICGDTEADKVKREAIMDGLKNTLVRVEMLDDVADVVLDIGGNWTEESETWPKLEDVLVIPAEHAPGDREGDVPKRPLNNDGIKLGPARVMLKFEDGQQAFDAPVTAAEIEDNKQRLLDFLTESSNDGITKHDVVAEGISLRLDLERELVQLNGGKLLPRMLPLTLSGALSRQLDVIEEGRAEDASAQKRRHGTQANADLRARLRACTQETKALPLEINLLATPGAEVSKAADGTVTVVLPAITRWPIDTKIDNLAGEKGWGAFLYPMRTRASGVHRNANNLVGGIGAGGGDPDDKNPRVSATNAERRLSMNSSLYDAKHDLHQTCGASLLEDFLTYNESPRDADWWSRATDVEKQKRSALEATAVKMNSLSAMNKKGEVVSPRRQGKGYEISAGKLRTQLPHCVLNAITRIFGDKGLIDHGRPAAGSDVLREGLWNKFIGIDVIPDDEKCKMLAAKLLLHALRYADYDMINKDLTRRVLPIFTDQGLVRFWRYAFGGIKILMEMVNAARPGTFDRDRVELVKASVGDYEVMKGRASVSVKVLSRIMSCLSPYQDTNKERGSLTKIAGEEVTHGMRVRESLRRSFRRVTGTYVADLTNYRNASETACESLVRGAEHILRLFPGPGESGFLLEQNQSLRERSGGGLTTFSKVLKTRDNDVTVKDDGSPCKFVHIVYLRVSAEDTAESETRFGFGVQLDIWKSLYLADRSDGLNFPSTARNPGHHHVVWIVSVRSRIAADQLDDPVAIFEEDTESFYRLPDLKTLTTATVRTAIGVVLAAKGKNRKGRLVTMSAMYADRVTLEEFTAAAPDDVHVVGFDALDLRPLIDFFPEIALADRGWKKRMIHVEPGFGGNALVAHRLGAALAVPCDLNVLRLAGFEAVNQATGAPNPEKTRKIMRRVAECTAKPLKVFVDTIVPRWFDAAVENLKFNGRAAVPSLLDFEHKPNKKDYAMQKFKAVLRHSGPVQLWRSQAQMLSWVGARELNKVYVRPFPATIDLTTAKDNDNKVKGNIQLTAELWDDGSPAPASVESGKIIDIMNGNFFASMSRAANPGVLEHALKAKNFLCLVDIAIAVKERELRDVWVRADADKPQDGCDFARRLNLRNPYVYAVLCAIRDGGHLPHRHLLGELSALGCAGANAGAQALPSAGA